MKPLMLTLVALAGLGLMIQPLPAEDKQDDACPTYTPKDLVGTYKVTAAEKSGLKTPKLMIQGMVVRFTETTVVATDRMKNTIHSCTYKLEPGEGPMAIVMVSNHESSKGQVARGLVARDGDTVKLIYSLPPGAKDEEGTTEPPTEFRTKKGQLMVVLEKLDEEPAVVFDKPSGSK